MTYSDSMDILSVGFSNGSITNYSLEIESRRVMHQNGEELKIDQHRRQS